MARIAIAPVSRKLPKPPQTPQARIDAMSSDSPLGPRPEAAPRAAVAVSPAAAPHAAAAVSDARAAASRRNGARSHGPKSPAGKARSAQNALKHGLCAKKLLVLPEEDPAAFRALEAALLAELAPVGALQAVLARQIVSAAWRLARAERLEVEMFAERRVPIVPDHSPALAMIRDGNCSRSFETLLRYRAAAMAELLRCLRTLQALQAEARAAAGAAPTRRRRGRPIVPANGRRPDRRAGSVPHPLATRQGLVATAARPASVPTASPDPDKRFPETVMPLALASLRAATERTQAITPIQAAGLHGLS
jgi:hypothetical protein